jgi:tRNA (guanine9-N1)-methyltransferase
MEEEGSLLEMFCDLTEGEASESHPVGSVQTDCSLDESEIEEGEAEGHKRTVKLTRDEKLKQKLLNRKLKKDLQIKEAKKRKQQKFSQLSIEEQQLCKEQRATEEARRAQNLERSFQSNVHVCIDLSFLSENSERELRSLAAQIRLSYRELKLSDNPLALHLTSWTDSGAVREILSTQGVENWKVYLHEEGVEESFPPELVTYLSPDAEEALPDEGLVPHRVYVIGGIVDRNIKRRVTLTKAEEQGYEVYRLPVREVFPESRNSVLNIDQVVRALCVFHTARPLSWETALRAAVPPRRRGGGGEVMEGEAGESGDRGAGEEEGEGEGGEAGTGEKSARPQCILSSHEYSN